ncbi:hypothetical protein TSAR_004703 [Trichomalopsis sarcophagae]|uniref:Reverse transcriptase domain-containing protein n=1 Tax=Trichomalopsis sarcophagae TaxID=543379 RepID=A0A232EH21_9HYME|nr:hypothetical protein TSAR_004703 [Trichomalopsis sarcophagae]
MYDRVLRLELPEGATVVGFTDDIAVLVVAKQKEEVTKIANEAVGIIHDWLKQTGLQFASHKKEAILVTSRKKIETITLTVDRHEIDSQPTIEYLRITKDAKLTSRPLSREYETLLRLMQRNVGNRVELSLPHLMQRNNKPTRLINGPHRSIVQQWCMWGPGVGGLLAYKQISTGVLQGTILGPSFFILYLNDQLRVLTKDTIMSYTDDTVIVVCDNTQTSAQNKINGYLSKVANISSIMTVATDITGSGILEQGRLWRTLLINSFPETRRIVRRRRLPSSSEFSQPSIEQDASLAVPSTDKITEEIRRRVVIVEKSHIFVLGSEGHVEVMQPVQQDPPAVPIFSTPDSESM